MNNCSGRLYNGIVKENPIFVLMLGTYLTSAVATSAVSGPGMGLSTTVVLLPSNMIIPALRKTIPDRMRIPTCIVIVASLVTVVQLLLQVYVPSLYFVLDVYVPLIVVSRITSGRAESYASKNGPLISTFNDIGMGLGSTLALTRIGLVREILGSGTIFGSIVIPEDRYIAILILTLGVFFILVALTTLQNKPRAPLMASGPVPQSRLARGGNCMGHMGSPCMSNRGALGTRKRQAEERALAVKREAVAKKEVELKVAISKREN